MESGAFMVIHTTREVTHNVVKELHSRFADTFTSAPLPYP
jgi:hypothetical protein